MCKKILFFLIFHDTDTWPLDQVPTQQKSHKNTRSILNNYSKFKLPNINNNKVKNTKRSSKQNGNQSKAQTYQSGNTRNSATLSHVIFY